MGGGPKKICPKNPHILKRHRFIQQKTEKICLIFKSMGVSNRLLLPKRSRVCVFAGGGWGVGGGAEGGRKHYLQSNLRHE